MTARPERHVYRDGYGRTELDRGFYIVRCDDCLVALNSGHHYPEIDGGPSPFALDIAARHNALNH